jgi:small subunit ribosomal protein S6
VKEYELTVLIHPDLEVDIETPLNKIRGIITKAGGEIVSEENWGKKKLAYRIKKEDFAVYVYFDIKLPADAPLKISGIFNISDEILRYLLVKVDEKNRRVLEEAKLKAASPDKADEQEEE